MKFPAILLVLFVSWVAARRTAYGFIEDIGDPRWMIVTSLLALALFASLVLVFVRAGRIHLEEDRLVVSTPLGFCKIPYSQIETIRRCRRKGRPQNLQIIFETLGQRKVLQIRPPNLSAFAAQLRRKCPRLSSSSDVVLVKKGGEGKLIRYA